MLSVWCNIRCRVVCSCPMVLTQGWFGFEHSSWSWKWSCCCQWCRLGFRNCSVFAGIKTGDFQKERHLKQLLHSFPQTLQTLPHTATATMVLDGVGGMWLCYVMLCYAMLCLPAPGLVLVLTCFNDSTGFVAWRSASARLWAEVHAADAFLRTSV